MNKKHLPIVIALPFLVSIPSKAREWPEKMKELREVYGALMSDVASDERFDDPKNRAAVERRASRLAELAKSLYHEKNATEKDLSIALLADLFRDEADSAARMLKHGNRAYARVMLKSIGGFCIACHSRVPGADLSNAFSAKPPVGATPVESGQYYAATRQFDRALQAYSDYLARPKVGNVFDFERAARSGLALWVRVKNDPAQTVQFIDRLLERADLPYFLREQAGSWRTEAVAWKAEKPKALATEDALFAEAKRLYAEARDGQKFPADRSADVAYLRATATLHQFLNRYPGSPAIAEALALLGAGYEVLGDVGLRDFHETYYVACIRLAPHTATSRKCYERYEESVYLGFTGSGGTSIPSDVRRRLNALETMAAPEPKAKSDAPARL